jgi:ubiquinone biosynthesis protein Coq4
LPGEVGSLPEGATRHDLTHVIGGYDTTPMGEIEVLSFTAGMKRTNPFAILFLGIGQFHMGLKIHPVAEPSRMTLTDPRAIVEGLEHGSRCAVDLLDTDWDYWPFIERPLDEVRAALGLA